MLSSVLTRMKHCCTAVPLGPEEVCGILIGERCGVPYDLLKTKLNVPKASPNPLDKPKVSCITELNSSLALPDRFFPFLFCVGGEKGLGTWSVLVCAVF